MIDSFSIAEAFPNQDGLRQGRLDRLGAMVVLAGPNGSGKTRLLRRIELTLKTWSDAVTFLSQPTIGQSVLGNPPTIQLARRLDGLLRERLRSGQGAQVLGTNAHAMANAPALEEVTTFETRKPAIDLRPAFWALSEPVPLMPEKSPTYNESKRLLLRLTGDEEPARLAPEALDFMRASLKASGTEATANEHAVRILSSMEQLLGGQVTVDEKGRLVRNHRLLVYSEQSAGEQRQLQAVPLLASKRQFPHVLIFDEPENHLHPDALLRLIAGLTANAPELQLWIATHSLPLVASIDGDCIWSMDRGKVSFVGAQSERVLEGLLGGEENVHQVYSFLGQPAELAAARFARECLSPPQSQPHRAGDPQISQCVDRILKMPRDSARLRVLDWGAGKGRVASGFVEMGTRTQIDYFAFDPVGDDETPCRLAIERLHESSNGRYFRDLEELRSTFVEHPVDFIVMCNVLHEIHPDEWVRTIGIEGMSAVLQRDGYLMIVEDLKIPHGELANPSGFLLLDGEGIGRLFADPSLSEIVVAPHPDPRYRDRLFVYAVPAGRLGGVTGATVRHAVDEVAAVSLKTIRELQGRLDAPRQARDYVRAVHQYVNAQLFLEQQSGP